jgi:hypothetical protein
MCVICLLCLIVNHCHRVKTHLQLINSTLHYITLLQIIMKSSCHFLFIHPGLPALRNSTQFCNSNSQISVVLRCTPLYPNSLGSLELNSSKRSSVSFIILRYRPRTEKTSIGPQWMSYFCHARLGRGVFSARCIAVRKPRAKREHCFYCCVFVGTCLPRNGVSWLHSLML